MSMENNLTTLFRLRELMGYTQNSTHVRMVIDQDEATNKIILTSGDVTVHGDTLFQAVDMMWSRLDMKRQTMSDDIISIYEEAEKAYAEQAKEEGLEQYSDNAIEAVLAVAWRRWRRMI